MPSRPLRGQRWLQISFLKQRKIQPARQGQVPNFEAAFRSIDDFMATIPCHSEDLRHFREGFQNAHPGSEILAGDHGDYCHATFVRTFHDAANGCLASSTADTGGVPQGGLFTAKHHQQNMLRRYPWQCCGKGEQIWDDGPFFKLILFTIATGEIRRIKRAKGAKQADGTRDDLDQWWLGGYQTVGCAWICTEQQVHRPEVIKRIRDVFYPKKTHPDGLPAHVLASIEAPTPRYGC